MDDKAFLHLFESLDLPWEQWTHRSHLRVAYLYLTQYPLEKAIDRVRAGIQAHNNANPEKIKPGSGYHETITQAFIRMLHPMIELYGRRKPDPTNARDASAEFYASEQFFDANPQFTSKRILFLYYTEELLMSDEARRCFVPPDLAPFPVWPKEVSDGASC
jgi:hypothetical protein